MMENTVKLIVDEYIGELESAKIAKKMLEAKSIFFSEQSLCYALDHFLNLKVIEVNS